MNSLLREPLSDLIMIEHNANNIRNIKDQTEDEQFLAVSNNPESIQYIRQPLIAVQELAVEIDPHCIKFFWKHATHMVRLAALDKDPTVIKYLPDSTIEEQKFVIMRNGSCYDLIQNRNWKTMLYQLLYWYKVVV